MGVETIGVTVSAVQARRAQTYAVAAGSVSIQLQDWLYNSFPAEHFDRAYAVESSEHMTDKQRFFDEAFRTLRPNGLFAVCAWLSCDEPQPREIRYLLEPICREGRLPGMGNEADYRRFAEQAGFRVVQVDDLSARVSRTWWICIRRVAGKASDAATVSPVPAGWCRGQPCFRRVLVTNHDRVSDRFDALLSLCISGPSLGPGRTKKRNEEWRFWPEAAPSPGPIPSMVRDTPGGQRPPPRRSCRSPAFRTGSFATPARRSLPAAPAPLRQGRQS